MNQSYIWYNEKLTPWADAKVHLGTHALHYGSSIFEGIRVYDTPKGPQFFRLHDHMRRMVASARVYSIDHGYTIEQLEAACHTVVAANEMQSAYVRPIIFRGASDLGVIPKDGGTVDVAVMTMSWGNYLGEALENGADVCVSSWRRPAPGTTPTWAKAGGNYLNSQLIALEAQRNGYTEGVSLAHDGSLSEGAGENLFLLIDGKLVTPPTSSSLLVGITRDCVIKLAERLGYTVEERALPREALYWADEVFMCGTAAEITPVRSVDRIPVGNGKVGTVTRKLQDELFGLFDGRTKDQWGWLTPVDGKTPKEAA